MHYRAALSALATVLAGVALSGCSLKGKRDGEHTIYIEVPGTRSRSLKSEGIDPEGFAGSPRLMTSMVANYVPGDTIDQFTCFGANFYGPGIAPNPRIHDRVCGGGYFGVMAGLVPITGGRIEAVVPEGNARRLNLFAVTSYIGCPRIEDIINDSIDTQSNLEEPYVVGSATFDVMSDTSVTIQTAYDATSTPRMFCEPQYSGYLRVSMRNLPVATGCGSASAYMRVERFLINGEPDTGAALDLEVNFDTSPMWTAISPVGIYTTSSGCGVPTAPTDKRIQAGQSYVDYFLAKSSVGSGTMRVQVRSTAQTHQSDVRKITYQ